MSALLALAMTLLVLNHWLHAQAREEPEDARMPSRSSAAFAGAAIAVSAVVVQLVREFALPGSHNAALHAVVAVLVIGVAVQIAHRFLLTKVMLNPRSAAALLRRTLLTSSVFAMALLHTTLVQNFGDALMIGITAGVGFELSLQVFGRIVARLERAPVPTPFHGAPITLITAGLMVLALLGLKDLF